MSVEGVQCRSLTTQCVAVSHAALAGVSASCFHALSNKVLAALSGVQAASLSAAAMSDLSYRQTSYLSANVCSQASPQVLLGLSGNGMGSLGLSPACLQALSTPTCERMDDGLDYWHTTEFRGFFAFFDSPAAALKLSNLTQSCVTDLPCTVWSRWLDGKQVHGDIVRAALNATGFHSLDARCEAAQSHDGEHVWRAVGIVGGCGCGRAHHRRTPALLLLQAPGEDASEPKQCAPAAKQLRIC